MKGSREMFPKTLTVSDGSIIMPDNDPTEYRRWTKERGDFQREAELLWLGPDKVPVQIPGAYIPTIFSAGSSRRDVSIGACKSCIKSPFLLLCSVQGPIKYSRGYTLHGISFVRGTATYYVRNIPKGVVVASDRLGPSFEEVIRTSAEFISDDGAREELNGLTRWLPYNLRHFSGRLWLRVSIQPIRSHCTAYGIHGSTPRSSPEEAFLRNMWLYVEDWVIHGIFLWDVNEFIFLEVWVWLVCFYFYFFDDGLIFLAVLYALSCLSL